MFMPVNRQALIRYRKIDEKIRNKYRPYPSIDELIDACSEVLGTEVSKSSIEKDLQAMKNDDSLGYNAPIKYNREHRGYYYTDADYTIEERSLSKEESEMVFLAMNTLFKLKNTGVILEYEQALEKIKEKLDLQLNISDLQILDFEHAPVSSGGALIRPLIKVIQAGKGLEIVYHKFGTPNVEERNVFPLQLKEHRNRWYLIAYDYDKSGVRIFGLERILEMESRDSIQPEELPDLQALFSYSIGVTVTDELPEEVVFKANKFWTPYLDSQPIHPSQNRIETGKEHNSYTLRVCVTHELVEKFLGFGKGVEVIAPKTLRNRIKEELTATLKQYN